jgi:hypothetical protein
LLKKLVDKTINLSALGESPSLRNYVTGERKMEDREFKYTTDQMAEIYAKLEVAKMLTKMGTDMARQAADDIKFYRMTNGYEDNE